MINLKAIDHVVFRVRDMQTMIGFYEDVLGARVERRIADIGLVQLRPGESLIDQLDSRSDLGPQGGPPPGRDGHNVDHVCFRVLPWDGEAVIAHLAAHGIEGAKISSRYGAEGHGPSNDLPDPEGNDIELRGPPWPPEKA